MCTRTDFVRAPLVRSRIRASNTLTLKLPASNLKVEPKLAATFEPQAKFYDVRPYLIAITKLFDQIEKIGSRQILARSRFRGFIFNARIEHNPSLVEFEKSKRFL
jgi:hypothetical protein